MTLDPMNHMLAELGGIAVRLRQLRDEAGLNSTELARRTGWQNSKISKLINGKQIPTIDDIRVWTEACGRSDLIQELIDVADEARTTHKAWKRQLRTGGHAANQENYVKMADEASLIRNYEHSIIPGSLQTADYARAVFIEMSNLHDMGHDIEDAVATRMKQQKHLYDSSKQWELLIDESILWRPIYGVEITLAQLDRLHSVIGIPTVKFGILPFRKKLRTTPQNSFLVYDDQIALVETFIGESRHSGSEAQMYASIMERLWRDAAEGEDARKLITIASQALSPS